MYHKPLCTNSKNVKESEKHGHEHESSCINWSTLLTWKDHYGVANRTLPIQQKVVWEILTNST
jgi:hypothetical protein